jgi:rhodanese-related sulfurtransferase
MFSRNQIVLGAVLLAIGAALAVASLRGEPKRRLSLKVETESSRRVEPRELAAWMIEGRRDFAVVDMRSAEDYAKGHLRQAVNCGSCHESKEAGAKAMKGEGFVDLSKKLVFYTEGDGEEILLPRLLHDNPRLYRLAGGWSRWQKEVLAPVRFEGISDEEQLGEARKRAAVRSFLNGERPAPVNARLPVTPIRRVGEHKAATASEGC